SVLAPHSLLCATELCSWGLDSTWPACRGWVPRVCDDMQHAERHIRGHYLVRAATTAWVACMSARRYFAALRWRIIRNGPNDERWFSLVAGLVAASGIIIVAGLSRNGTLDPSWLTVALTVFGLTWFVGPILVPAASPMLDPQWFRMLPQRPRQVAAAMAASEAAGE